MTKDENKPKEGTIGEARKYFAEHGETLPGTTPLSANPGILNKVGNPEMNKHAISDFQNQTVQLSEGAKLRQRQAKRAAEDAAEIQREEQDIREHVRQQTKLAEQTLDVARDTRDISASSRKFAIAAAVFAGLSIVVSVTLAVFT